MDPNERSSVDEEEIVLEGMDVEDIGDEPDNNIDNDDNEKSSSSALPPVAEDVAGDAEEAQELEQARQEQKELMAAEQTERRQAPATAQERLEYLLAQSDVFAHFLAGSVAAAKQGKKGSRGKSNRLTEAEEDAQLLKSAQSKRRVVRLDQQPSLLEPSCKMYPYQLEGLNWLIKLHDHGINGILADEMGLGKTLQTIALLAYLREARSVRGPHLVIVPKSVAGNWIREFHRFCPTIRVIKMGGTKEEREIFINQHLPLDQLGRRKFDVLVTSYEGFLKEKGKLGKIDWKYLIIDEAHRIKNEKSSLSLGVRNLRTEFRLLITGTPLQNNLRELWALLNFLMPDIFGDAEQFDQWFSLEDEHGKENVIKKLHTVLKPFMLRRVKRDVAASLPPKKETKLYVGLTDMQHDWYVRCLRKDAHELNKLGGPDRNRLLNVLMQLRKVCNHPYLFDGAEAGPPYVDGPHLWENSGKMQLLHKLLPKLKARGSRVLIFSQMTRVLDILEDYVRLVGHEYCRLDGNTDGERRESQIQDFNAEDSTKFVFLLSTRAGGLGINLATADIVILFDSDWNPQVDLQAMDRAHRIGQKKPVQVFRFISEGTVEEKIIERAERKLFLDAAVIQQGRLAEQNSSLEKDELMKMVRFGADQILSGKSGTYSDEDIDALIARGEERTVAMQAKLQTDVQHNLANFSLLADEDNGTDTFTFDGKNYRDTSRNVGNFINLPQRERKRNYDLSSQAPSGKLRAHEADVAAKKRRKGPAVHDFQLFDTVRLEAIVNKEKTLALQKESQVKFIKELRQQALTAPAKGSGVAAGHSREELLQRANELEHSLVDFKLSPAEESEREKLLSEGFPDWSRKDFRSFCASLERHGRYDFASISRDVMSETNKDLSEIQRYYVAFWTSYQRIGEWPKILDKIEKGEKKILRLRQIRDAIQEKVERHLEDTFGPHYRNSSTLPSVEELLKCSWSKMKINYAGNRGKGYQEDEDSFLLYQMFKHGFGAAERIRMEIRRAWQFRFDWYFKSRSALEIQKRCDTLVRIIERENEDLRQKEEMNNKPATGVESVDDKAEPAVVGKEPLQ